jgi:type I restriction enzyme R subunit
LFQDPPTENLKAKLKKEKKAALQKLAAQEVQLQELLLQIDTMRARAQAKSIEKSEPERHEFRAVGQATADALRFDEKATRKRLIDKQLIAVGWDINPDRGNTAEVAREVETSNQPTKSGTRYADYILWDNNGKPLAVIEAKKAALTPEKGRTQAKL